MTHTNFNNIWKTLLDDPGYDFIVVVAEGQNLEDIAKELTTDVSESRVQQMLKDGIITLIGRKGSKNKLGPMDPVACFPAPPALILQRE